VNGWQIQYLYRQKADTANVFDELKNQWDFCGFMREVPGHDRTGRPPPAHGL